VQADPEVSYASISYTKKIKKKSQVRVLIVLIKAAKALLSKCCPSITVELTLFALLEQFFSFSFICATHSRLHPLCLRIGEKQMSPHGTIQSCKR